MLKCREAAQLVSESLDRKLSWRERVQVTLHLLMCKICARFRRQTRFLHAAANHYASRDFDLVADSKGGEQLSTESRARMKAALRTKNG